MLNTIYIAGHECNSSCHDILKSHPKMFDAIIICNRKHKEPSYLKELTKSYLTMHFDDVAGPYGNSIPPSQEHVKQMLDWSEGKEDMVIACHAGISRSSATALLIGLKNWGIDKAFSILDRKRHSPNPLIVKYGDGILGIDIHSKLLDWQSGKWTPNQGQ